MTKKILKSGMELRDYLNSLPVCQYKQMRERMMEACKVPYGTFNNWRNGACRIPELHKDMLEQVAGCKIFSKDDD